MSIFKKILIACALPVLLLFAVITVIYSIHIQNLLSNFAKEKSHLFSVQTKEQINDNFERAKHLLSVMSKHLGEIDHNCPGAYITAENWVKTIVQTVPNVKNIWFSFEEGTFFPSERFSRDFVRYSEDSVIIKINLDDVDFMCPVQAPWYYTPFKMGIIWFLSADLYDFQLGEGEQYTSTVSMPVKRGGKTIGVVGVDLLFDDTFNFLHKKQEESRLLMMIITEEGKIAYSTHRDYLAKSIFDVGFANSACVIAGLPKGDFFEIHDTSPFFRVLSNIYFYPIIQGIDGQILSEQLFLYVDFPNDQIQSLWFTQRTVFMVALIGLFVLGLILFFVVKNILNPIVKLTKAANEIASGKPDLNIDSIFGANAKQRDVKNMGNEIYVLFESMKKMLAKLDKAEELSRLTEKLKIASKAKSDFLAKMSHEIRTPMNAVIGMAELALKEDMPPAAKEQIYTIKQAGGDLLSIVNDILDISKIESGKLSITPEKYHFSSMLNDVVSIVRMRVRETGVKFTVNVDGKIPDLLLGDELRIKQVLLNILSNAAKYTKKGHITFIVSGKIINNDVFLTFDVIDSGKGIKKVDVEKLFNDYSQVDLESNKGIEGAGLGLAIAKNLINMMNGNISVESLYGKGSKFTVKVPQKIISLEPLAKVENSRQKSVLVYERCGVYADSILYTMVNLDVDCVCAETDEEFYEKLKAREFSFVFVEYGLLEIAKAVLEKSNSKAKIVLIADFVSGGAYGGDYDVVEMPVFPIAVANILNGVSDDFSYNVSEDTIARFCAPDARILIVDDIMTNLKVAEGLMMPYKMKVDLLDSGKKAVEAVKINKYDLVFMDHMMPEMDGIETTKIIRETNLVLPIIALTANAVSGAREMFLNNGFNDFLSKPIDTIKLSSVLKKWLPQEKQLMITEKLEIEETGAAIHIDGVDVQLGLSRIGGKQEIYLQTLAIFRKDGITKIEEIKNALNNGNYPLYTTLVHAIKSASANIGAEKISKVAKNLEAEGKEENVAVINQLTPKFLADFQILLDKIGKALSKNKENNKKEAINLELLANELSKLKGALGEFDIIVIDKCANDLREFTQYDEFGAIVESILQHTLIGGYDEAVSEIEILLDKIKG